MGKRMIVAALMVLGGMAPTLYAHPAHEQPLQAAIRAVANNETYRMSQSLGGVMPGRTCRAKILNGMLIGVSFGVVVGFVAADTESHVEGALYGAFVFGSLGTFMGFKSCRP